MRLVGVIGGMSPESTVLYYRFMNDAVRAATGDPAASARVIMHCVDFAHLKRLQEAGEWAVAGTLLADAARGLVQAGAEFIVISANTMHICAEDVASAVPGTPLIHIGDVIVQTAGAGSKMLLLGTKYTMELPFLREYITARGVVVDIPDADTRDWLQRIIFNELARGIVAAETKVKIKALFERAAAEGYNVVALGCTELGLLADGDSPVQLIDTARAHAQAIVDAALAQK